MSDPSTDFAPWLVRWGIVPDGEPLRTAYAGNWLLPVRRDGAAGMLKVAQHPEDARGAAVMVWWNGDGAARVLAQDETALLLERLDGPRSLAAMARTGADDEASRILCAVADRLHAPRPGPPCPGLWPLRCWLRALLATDGGGVMAAAASVANRLLTLDEEPCVLHGDLHHGNVLDGGDKGWAAIDPKGIFGPRGYDYANILCNPDPETALTRGRLDRQIAVVAQAARIDRRRLLEWLLVHAAAAGAWCVQDGFDPRPAFALAEQALTRLG